MNTNRILRGLRYQQEKRNTCVVHTGELDISAMCKDAADAIESLQELLMDTQIELTRVKRSSTPKQAAPTVDNQALDYICAVQHYNKYDSSYTFALTSQWYNLEFTSLEDYQEFQMQLVYILGEAKEKWDTEWKCKSCDGSNTVDRSSNCTNT